MSNYTGFTAPETTSNKLDVALLPNGMQLCTFYGLADIGSQDTNFGIKPQVNLAFEFPLEQREFYEGDGVKPCAIFNSETFSMASKANLRTKFIEPMIGRKLSDDEANSFDMSQLLGKHFVATIQHTSDGKYANIVGITPLSDQNKKMYDVGPEGVNRFNDIYFFHTNHGYNSDNFANLPKFLRNKIRESQEGKQHLATGGQFKEPVSNNNNSNQATPVVTGKKFVLNANAEHTLEAYKASGWSEEALVASGFGTWQEPTAPPSMPGSPAAAPQAPSAPAAPQQPSAPVPQQPIAPAAVPPPANVPAQKVLIMNPGEPSKEEYYASGWTDEMLVQHNHATWSL